MCKGLKITDLSRKGGATYTFSVHGVIRKPGGLPQKFDRLYSFTANEVKSFCGTDTALYIKQYLLYLIYIDIDAMEPLVDDGKRDFLPETKNSIKPHRKGYNEQLRKRVLARKKRIFVTKLKTKKK